MQEQIKVVIASGASTSSAAQFSRVWPMYGIQVGTMSTGTVINLFTSTDAGTSFYQVFHPPNASTSTVTNLGVQIGSLVGTNGGYVVVPGGHSNLQMRLTAVVSGGVSFNVIGLDLK